MAETKSTKPRKRNGPNAEFGAGLQENGEKRHDRPELDDLDREPLSLAEELAEEAEYGRGDETHDRYEQIKQGDIHIAELQRMSMPQLIEQARKENLTDYMGIKKQDLIFKILKERVKLNG